MTNVKNNDVATDSNSEMKKWTIIIYLAGDNNLSQDMITAILAIERITENARANGTYLNDVAFVIEYDSVNPATKTRRYIITKNEMITAGTLGANRPGKVIHENLGKTIIEMSEQADTSLAIENLVKWSIEQQPAENYALILSGHSDAFQGRTLLLDENQDTAMTLKKLKESLTKLSAVLPKKKLDILAFDGCMMNSFEVIYELKQLAEIWIGSQGSIPNYTWDYQNITEELIKGTVTTKDVARCVVEKTKKYNENYTFGGRSIDISYCKLDDSTLERVLENIGLVAEMLIVKMLNDPELCTEEDNRFSFVQRLLLKARYTCQTSMQEQAVDIKDFCNCLQLECVKVLTETIELFDYSSETALSALRNSTDAAAFREEIAKTYEITAKATEKIIIIFEIYNTSRNLITSLDDLEICGSFAGADYQFSKGISIFYPWTFFPYIQTKHEFNELEFTKNRAGDKWKLFFILQLILTGRFSDKQCLIDFLETDEDDQIGLLKIDGQLALLNKFIQKIDTKDNPALTRGSLEYLQYFGRTRNVIPCLKVEGDFC